jgi:hypothetical protein
VFPENPAPFDLCASTKLQKTPVKLTKVSFGQRGEQGISDGLAESHDTRSTTDNQDIEDNPLMG